MDAKYQKYYNGLKGKDFSPYVSKYKSSIDDVKNKLSSAQGSISEGSWSEKGIKLVKDTVFPVLTSEAASIENGLGVLASAVSKVGNLYSKLESLDKACKNYDNCKEEEKETYRNEVDSIEKSIDAIIGEINGMSLEIENKSVSAYSSAMTTLTELNSIQALKEEFLGDVDDSSQYYTDPRYRLRAGSLVCFDNTTGQILKEGDTLYMKPGETRILTVKLPNDSGMINQIVRTTADGNGAYNSGKYLTARSDVNPDPNVIDYVNYKSWSNHWPKGVNLHTNHYDWVLTANSEGVVTISQTCEYTNKSRSTPKAMVDLKVVIKS